MKKVIALVLAVAMVFALAACGGGSSNNGNAAVKPIELTLGHTNNTEHHYHTLSTSFQKYVEQASNGTIKINVFPAEQLGSGQAMLESVKTGTQDMVLDPDAYLANHNGLFNVCSLAYLYSDWSQTDAFLNSEARTILEKAAEDSGFIILGWTANGFRYFTMKKGIESLADMQGKKLRCGSNQLVIDLFSSLGLAPTSLSMSDTYNGISTGTVDGQENSLANIIGYKFYEVAPNVLVTRHMYSWEPLIMSKTNWDKLTADQQKILKEAGEKACAEDYAFCKTSEQNDLDAIKKAGGNVIELDVTEFKTRMAAVNDAFVKKQNAEFQKLYEIIEKISK